MGGWVDGCQGRQVEKKGGRSVANHTLSSFTATAVGKHQNSPEDIYWRFSLKSRLTLIVCG